MYGLVLNGNKQHVTVVTGDGDVADISRDGTYIAAGKLSRCECRNREGLWFKWLDVDQARI